MIVPTLKQKCVKIMPGRCGKQYNTLAVFICYQISNQTSLRWRKRTRETAIERENESDKTQNKFKCCARCDCLVYPRGMLYPFVTIISTLVQALITLHYVYKLIYSLQTYECFVSKLEQFVFRSWYRSDLLSELICGSQNRWHNL